MRELYDVILLGPASTDPEAVERLKRGLAERLCLSAKEASGLIASTPLRVKRGVSWEEAQRVRSLLESIGAKVEVQRQGPRVLPPRTIKCPQCGYLQPEGEECVRCGVIFSKYQRYRELKQRPLRREVLPSWEKGEGGALSAFLETVKGVLFSPTGFFQGMAVRQGLGPPLLFGVIVGTIGGLMPLLWSLLVSARGMGITPFSSAFLMLYGVLMPAFVAVGIFVTSGVLHLCLMLVGGERSGFEATFRVVAYGQAANLWTVLPLVGPFVSGVYALIIYIVGLREVHGIGTGRAALAVFLPAVALMIVIVLAISAVLIPLIMDLRLLPATAL